MTRWLALLLAGVLVLPLARAQDDADSPPISITSPDHGTTYAYGEIKHHALLYQKSASMLIARITFTDQNLNLHDSEEETLEFRLPGVTYDATRKLFCATTAKGEVIPVARYKKTLFLTSIETLPNARVRILHPHGSVTVILEAIPPDDPAMRPPPPADPDDTRPVEIKKIVN